MGINQTLLREIDPFLEKYDCEKRDIERVLNSPHVFERYFYRQRALETRRRGVLNSISAIMEPHGKRHLFEHVSQLCKLEDGMRLLLPHHRDHVIHALLCFVLGIYINERFIPNCNAQSADNFQWEIAALFHDVGYPVEMASKAILGPYYETMKGHATSQQPLPDVFCKLSKGQTSLALIQAQIDKWSLSIDVEAEYQKMSRPKYVNHGIISAITILNRIDTLYQKQNPNGEYRRKLSEGNVDWNQKYFDEDIVPACSAIFVHGLNSTCFKKSRIALSRAPVAFLLKLTDTLQEWDRPLKAGDSYPSTLFDIEVNDGRLIFFARIPDLIKRRMRSEITDCLEDPHVEIQ